MARQKSRAMSPAQLKKLTDLGTNDVQKLTKAQLRELVKPLAAEASRRVEQINKSGVYSPAAEAWKENKHVFNKPASRASLGQLRSQYVELQKFMKDKTSSVTGAKRVRSERNRMIGGPLPKKLEKTFWDAWNRFKEKPGNYVKGTAKDDMKNLREIIKSGDKDFNSLVSKLEDMRVAEYEQAQAQKEDQWEDIFF